MIIFTLWEVAPPPEVVEPAAALIEDGIGAAVGFLGGLLRPVRDALVAAAKWIMHLPFVAIRDLRGFVDLVNVAVAQLDVRVVSEISDLTSRLESGYNAIASAGGASAAGALGAAIGYADGLATRIWNDMRSLYNQSVWHADAVGQQVLADAENLYNQSVWHADAVGQAVLADAEGLYNGAIAHADAVAGSVAAGARDLFDAVPAEIGQAVDVLEGAIADVRPYAAAVAAAAGTAAIAQAMTLAEAAFGECCAFTTDQIKPAWDKVKGLLGKLTRRGPLALVVLGAAAEYVASFDRAAVIGTIRDARRSDGGTSLGQLAAWAGRPAA